MLKLPYRGASTLDDQDGHEAVICRDAETARWLAELIAAVGSLATAVESARELSIVRTQIQVVEVWRQKDA